MVEYVDPRKELLMALADEFPELKKAIEMYMDFKSAQGFKDRVLVACKHKLLDEDICAEARKLAEVVDSDDDFRRIIQTKILVKALKALKLSR